MEHRSWLVQRLQKPHPTPEGHPAFAKDNPWAFGGGYKNGGLSDDAMDLLRSIWRFDYMGAAEFEFGAVPEALSLMAKAKLAASSFTISLSDVATSWRRRDEPTPEGEATIYVLCPAGWQVEVERRVRGWAGEIGGEDFRTKEATHLAAALRPVEDWDRDTCGWLEISNGFLFFTDAEMWEKACALFGVVTKEQAAA